jgi:NAD(P)H-hydrate epimerase
LEGVSLLREKLARATALVAGPGLGAAEESRVLIGDLLKVSTLPVVLDADALQPAALAALAQKPGRAAILTPHAGEFARIASRRAADSTTEALRAFCAEHGLTVVLKGPVTRIAGGPGREVYHSLCGGPVLARGGSGDLLAGLIGGLLAQTPGEPLLAACRGTVWHGAAADCLARAHGQTAVRATQLLDFLPEALRSVNHDD